MIRRCSLPPTGAAATAATLHRASVPMLETVRLRLRAPNLQDLPQWTEIFTGPASHGFGGPFTPEDAWAGFSSYTACWMLHGHGLWTVERREDGEGLGFVHLGLEWCDDEPELGWLFLPRHQGQGYAAEAAAAARAWGLELLPGFVSYVEPGNAPSNRLARRLGATRDAAAEAAILASEGGRAHVWRHTRNKGAA
ncbi:MAG: GNAT family N-acetyltransferase [Rhodobacteraceae bacterium]|nr:GNAT family N-acetyltransferase [Paracoccaceae bacterium]